MKNLSETSLSSEQVFCGRLLDVRRDRVRLPDGQEAEREYIKHPGAVVIIPVLDDGRLLFERQYRYAVQQICLELPAGKIDKDELPSHAAVRELREETGYVAARWRYLGLIHPAIGYADERIDIFLAQGLSCVGAAQFDPGEFLELCALSLEEAVAAVGYGELTDAKTISALFWAEKTLSGQWP